MLVQVYRLGSPLPRHLEQRRKVIVRDTAIEADVCLDCRPAQMPIENCLRASSWMRSSALSSSSPRRSTARGDSSRSVALITSGTPGLPPGLALRPGSQCPRSSRSTMKPPRFSSAPPAHVEGTNILTEPSTVRIGVRRASGAISNLPHVTPTLGGVGRRSYFAPVSAPDDPEFVPIRADLARPFILHKADMGLTRWSDDDIA